MRIVIVTDSRNGFASFCLPYLARDPGIEIAMIVYNEGRAAGKTKGLKRKINKILKIGILGAINGIRMRRWYREDVIDYLKIEDLDVVAGRFGMRLETTPAINCQRTMDLFKDAGVDLGLTLGTGYVGQKIFSIPKYGMINVHHEILPQFQGAQSIIWQIYNGSDETGYTIHQIDSKIDTGTILYQERRPIEFKPALRETVGYNYALLYKASVSALIKVIVDYPKFKAAAKDQAAGRPFTTPTFRQYLRMLRNHARLYKDILIERARHKK